MFSCLSQRRRPGEGDPADQARHHDALRTPVRKPRMSAEVEARQAPSEYPWRMPASWWTRKRHYFLYVVREFTALPLAIWLLWLLYDITQKTSTFGPAFAVFSIFCLPFALYHSYTFLSLAGSIIHFKVLDRPVSPRLIVASQFALWIGGTLVIGLLLLWLAPCARMWAPGPRWPTC